MVQLKNVNFMFWSDQRSCFPQSHREFAASFPGVFVSRSLSPLFLEKEDSSGPLVRLIPMIP